MRKYLDINDYYGEIRLSKSAEKKNSIRIIVEAKADELFYRRFFSDDTIFFSVNGASNVINLIEKTQKNHISNVIGIIDADFKHITKEIINIKNIFLTDCHDVEMMTVFSKTWNNIIDYYKDSEKLDKFEKERNISLKQYILNISKQIACVRLFNLMENLDLKFKNFIKKKKEYDFIDYKKFINENNLFIDKEKMLKTIENKSEKQNFFKNKPKYRKKIKAICKENNDLKNLCNGHDFMSILSIALRKVVSNKIISGKELEEQFAMSYRLADFKLTKLYDDLLKWEKENFFFIKK